MKSPIGACARRALGALLLLQFGEARGPVSPRTADPQRNADNLKAASYYLGNDAVGLCAVPSGPGTRTTPAATRCRPTTPTR
jgi:hypothetical protein